MKNKLTSVFLILAVIFMLPNFAAAETLAGDENAGASVSRFGDWTTVGPNGGDVRAIVVDPTNSNHFYFSTLDGQIYTSTDAGKNWQFLTSFNRPTVLDSLMIDSRDSKTMYVGGHRHKEPGGFYKTSDGGKSWRESKDLKKLPIYAITQSVSNPDMIVAGTGDGVYASFDSGNEWKKISDQTVNEGLINVESLAIDPRNADIIYAGTWYLPYKTTDGGKNWRVIKQGMIDDSDVFAINIDPRNADHIIASACSGIYESYNKGENWKKVQGIPSTSRRTRDILQHPSKAGYIYAATTEGLWMTADNGANWTLQTSRQLEINSISVHPEEPNKVYLGTNNYGVMVSTDFGKTFAQTNAGYSTRQTNQIVADTEQPNRFYATTINTAGGGGFFFISTDGGASWRASMKNFPARLTVYSILQDAKTPDTIYLGTGAGIYRSLDRGVSWAAVTAPKSKTPAKKRPAPKRKTAVKKVAPVQAETVAAAVAPKPAARVAALTDNVTGLVPTSDGKNGMFAATENGLYRTYDIAQGWELIAFPAETDRRVMTFAVSPQNPQILWVGTARSGVLVSRDGGANWTKAAVTSDYAISRVAVSPQDSNRVYVGTKQTLYMSKDGGQTWDRRGGGLPAGDYNSIAINPSDADEIFVASPQENRDGLYHSIDGGKSWQRVDTNKLNLPSRRIWSLNFDARNPNQLLVGSHSAGIYRIERNQTAAVNE